MGDSTATTASIPKGKKLCLHCKYRRGSKRRGLCSACHGDRVIRNLYGPLSSRGNKVYHFDCEGPMALAALPTNAPPGSEEKIRILSERFAARVSLFHPLDGKLDMSALPIEKVEGCRVMDRQADANRAKPPRLTPARPKNLNRVVGEFGRERGGDKGRVRVTVYVRPSKSGKVWQMVWQDRATGEPRRKSSGTADVEVARKRAAKFAKAMARDIAEQAMASDARLPRLAGTPIAS